MLTSKIDLDIPAVLNVRISRDTLAVDLDDGRSLSVPLAWYPRCCTPRLRNALHGAA